MKCLLVSALVAVLTSAAVATVHDLNAEWSDTFNPFNNWVLLKNATQPFTINQPDFMQNGTMLRAWADEPFQLNAHVPVWSKVQSESAQYKFGDVWMHGAEFDRTGSNVTGALWTAPVDGAVCVEGMVWAPSLQHRTTRWEVSVAGSMYCSQTVISNGSVLRDNATPITANLKQGEAIFAPVQAGQRVAFWVTSVSEGGNLGDGLAMQVRVHFGPLMMLHGTALLTDWTLTPVDVQGEFIIIDSATGSMAWRTPMPINEVGGWQALFPVTAPSGQYRVLVKANHWLAREVGVVTWPGAEVFGLDGTLVNGDVDGDNEVGPGDFGLLSYAFGSAFGDANWVANADLDGDGEVGPSDFGILSPNFGLTGDS